MSQRQQIAADIPHELEGADEVLRCYGRSVMDRYKKQRCGSAEGNFKIPPNNDDREPREVLLPANDLDIVQRALISVPELYRVVLHILYVPKRLPAEAQLRRLHIPPLLSATRHLEGLRQFASRHRAEVVKMERAAGGLRRIRNHAVTHERLVLWLDKAGSQ